MRETDRGIRAAVRPASQVPRSAARIALPPFRSPKRRIGSAMARAAVKRGLRLSVGVLKHHLDFRARPDGAQTTAPEWRRCLRPRRSICPAVGSSSRITIIEVVDFPHPDSPTRPTVSPRCTLKERLSTARNGGIDGLAREQFAKPAAGLLPRIFLDAVPRPSAAARSTAAQPTSGDRRRVVGEQSRSVAPGRGVACISLRV